MKLKNKKTGEIRELPDGFFCGDNLKKICKEWEDYEEPKEWYWFIEDNGVIQRSCHYEDLHPTLDKARKEIGNYFETREEAEKAVEKLKAWKRLKDKGFRFLGYHHRLGETKSEGEIGFEMDDYEGTKQDLDLLFSGGEE